MTNLSEREWTVLTALWDSGGAALGDLTEALRPETGWRRNTVLPYLARMAATGLVNIGFGPGSLSDPGAPQLSPAGVPGLRRGPGGGLFEGGAHFAPGAGAAAEAAGRHGGVSR